MFKAVVKEELRVPAHIDYLGELRNFVTKTGKKHGFPESIVNAFKLSVDEAATNIIKHAYRDSDGGDVIMRIVIKRNSMTVILIDQGRYFDPTNVKDPDLKRYVEIGKKGGLGIFMIRKLIDEYDYRHTEEGNELRMTKFRDGSFRRREDAKHVEASSPQSILSFSLKTRYSLIAAAILTAIVMVGYIYNYFTEAKRNIQELLRVQQSYASSIASTVLDPGKHTLEIPYIAENIGKTVDLREHDEIYRVLVLDPDNTCLYTSHEADGALFLEKYTNPPDTKQLFDNVMVVKLADRDIKVYDIVSPVLSQTNDEVGTIHLQIKGNYVDKTIRSKHFKNLRGAVLILLMGYAGIVILIYLILNPFNKLADWIKDLGHGEVEDEIDFDTSDEVGEIAKAFSEITDKFRQSQVNLAEQERLQKEMQLAQDIQQTLLPPFVPEIEGYEIASLYQSAKEVGGDYYDFVDVDKDSLGIVVADVSGKGVPGSLIMTMIRTALRTEARGVKSASEVLARLNQFVVKDMKKGMFVTIFYVIIDSKRRRLNYASAGHNPMILYRPSTNKTYYLNPKGFPVGISLPDPELFKNSIESDTIQLAEDDVLLIYTDGITEAMNQRRKLFGEERLLDAIRKYSNLRVKPFSEKLQEEIESFTQGYEQSDDITLVAIKEKSTPEKIELHRAQLAHRHILDGMSIRDACQQAGITTYAYYNKYKKIFEEDGIEAYSIDETISVESKHLSIEEKTKIYDIIKKYPEFGAKRISEELNTERYEYTIINESRVYDELVRSRLNTRQLREAYVSRSGRKKRMKPPGTPMLTLDGRVILDRNKYEMEEEEERIETEKEVAKKAPTPSRSEKSETTTSPSKDMDDDFYIESLVAVPIEELFHKKHGDHAGEPDNLHGIDEPEDVDDEDDVDIDDEIEEIDVDADLPEPTIGIDDSESVTDKKPFDPFAIDTDIEFEESEIVEDDDSDDSTLANTNEPVSEDAFSLVNDDFSFSGMFDEQLSEVEYLDSDDDEPEDETVLADSEPEVDDSYKKDYRIDDDQDDENSSKEQHVPVGGLEDIFDDEIGFERLMETTHVSLKSYFSDSGGNGENEPDENGGLNKIDKDEYSTPRDEDDELSSEPELNKEFSEDYSEECEDIPELIDDFDVELNDNIQIQFSNVTNESNGKNESKVEADEVDELTQGDISFHDLLAEIENDVSLLDENLKNNKIQFSTSSTQRKEEPAKPQSAEENKPAEEKDGQFSTVIQDNKLILGLKYYKEKRYKEAIHEFEQIVELYPNFKELHSMLGNAYFRNGMIARAMDEYGHVKKLDPRDVDAYENIGVIYANKGEYKNAIKEWQSLLEIDPSRLDIQKHVEKAKTILEKDNINV
ncbi:SpoIIE family protein phosphatase [candidate division KSB1 bacterium]|nr:SpoIIE family protein phosphatase [candidate division KSB1 bacterium]